MTDQTTHQKAFSIAAAEPDFTSLILAARDEVVDDPTISHGAARMFVKILDLSLRQSSNVRPGVVTISQTKLADTFGVSNRTIWSWKWELLKHRVLWMTSQPMPNAWPIDTYHITAIHPPASSGEKTSVEGLWGNGYRQSRPQNTKGASALPQEMRFWLCVLLDSAITRQPPIAQPPKRVLDQLRARDLLKLLDRETYGLWFGEQKGVTII